MHLARVLTHPWALWRTHWQWRGALVWTLLALIVLVGGTLRVLHAVSPALEYEAADERAYGSLAKSVARERRYGGGVHARLTEPLHWPPGAPGLFAAADRLTPTPAAAAPSDIPAAYWLQASAGTVLILITYALGALLAHRFVGLVAAAVIASYPPLIYSSGELTSEPLGAALFAGSLLALITGLRDRLRNGLALGGALFGLTILTRTDLAPSLGVVVLIASIAVWRDAGALAAVRTAGSIGAAAALVILPWSVYASRREGALVPVTTGSGAALYVGTYLPGNGTTVGMKFALERELRGRYPRLQEVKTYKLPARLALGLVAERHPDRPRDSALRIEASRNLVRYGLGRPASFGLMMLRKVGRMWFAYYRGGGRHYIRGALTLYHRIVVVLSAVGLALALVRRRVHGLAVVAGALITATLVHAIFVAQARYNLPLVAPLVAAGAAGWYAVLSAMRSRDARESLHPTASSSP